MLVKQSNSVFGILRWHILAWIKIWTEHIFEFIQGRIWTLDICMKVGHSTTKSHFRRQKRQFQRWAWRGAEKWSTHDSSIDFGCCCSTSQSSRRHRRCLRDAFRWRASAPTSSRRSRPPSSLFWRRCDAVADAADKCRRKKSEISASIRFSGFLSPESFSGFSFRIFLVSAASVEEVAVVAPIRRSAPRNFGQTSAVDEVRFHRRRRRQRRRWGRSCSEQKSQLHRATSSSFPETLSDPGCQESRNNSAETEVPGPNTGRSGPVKFVSVPKSRNCPEFSAARCSECRRRPVKSLSHLKNFKTILECNL